MLLADWQIKGLVNLCRWFLLTFYAQNSAPPDMSYTNTTGAIQEAKEQNASGTSKKKWTERTSMSDLYLVHDLVPPAVQNWFHRYCINSIAVISCWVDSLDT